MRPAPIEKVGVLVMTVWMEQSLPRGLRARLTHTLDVSSTQGTSVSAAAGIDEISVFVRQWLERFVDDASTATPSRVDLED
jgi:hypothetical protein